MAVQGSSDKAEAAVTPPVVVTAAVPRWAELEGAGAGAGAALAEAWDGKQTPTDLQLLSLLALLCAGSPCPRYVHNVDVYSASPEHLFMENYPHAPGTGHGKQNSCYFFAHARPIESINKHDVVKRNRKIVVGHGFWRAEKSEPICAADGSAVGRKRRFSYQVGGGVSTGWIMFETSCNKHEHDVDSMVLCSIHKSNTRKNHPVVTFMADEASKPEDSAAATRRRKGKSVLVAEEARYTEKAATAGDWIKEVANISIRLVAAAETTVNGGSKHRGIDEFHRLKMALMRTLHELRLDASILTGQFQILDVHHQYLLVTQAGNLSVETRAHLLSLGESMTDTIYSAYLDESVKRARKAIDVLKDVRADAHMVEQVWRSHKAQSHMELIQSTLDDACFLSKVKRAQNKRPGAVDSSAPTSGATKRMAYAPPANRPEVVDLQMVEMMMLAGDDETADGVDVDVDEYEAMLWAELQLNSDGPPVQADQPNIAEVAPGLPAEGSVAEGHKVASYQSGPHVAQDCQAASCGECMMMHSGVGYIR